MNTQRTPPRILYVGYIGERLNQRSRSYQRLVALQELGCATVAISVCRDDDDPKPGRLGRYIESARTRLGIPVDVTDANQRILETAASGRFDLVWVDRGLEIFPSTIRKLKALRPAPKLALWMEEHARPRVNRSRYSMANLRHYDFVFTPRSQNCESHWVRRFRSAPIHLVNDTYDRHAHRPGNASAVPENYETDVGFIGTFETQRAADMLYLARRGIRVRVWGSNWGAWRTKHRNLVIESGPIYGDAYAHHLFNTKINLCFLRRHNLDRQTNRTFEIPACGGFMLAERSAEHVRLFREGTEAAYFGSDVELLQQVRHYLADDILRRAVALAGHKRCLSQGHSHHDRLGEMLELMGMRVPERRSLLQAAQ